MGGRGVARGLVGGVALLLTAGIVSAATVDPVPPTTLAADGRVTPAGLGQASLLDEPTTTSSTVVRPVPPSITVAPSTTSSTKPSTTTTTTSVKPAATTTLPTMPAGNIRPASSWQGSAPGVSVKMRIEPAAPTAGQPVRIDLDVSGVDACCYVFLEFGDNSARFAMNNEWACQGVSPLTPGPHSTVVTHTYAEPGAYLAYVQVMDGDLCTLPPIPPTDGPVPLHHVGMHACVAVGPRAATEGCAPLPPPPF